ncbi:MAG: hypothetical protein IPP90_11105 [Gemmatimonadaceae bacterium]|nr:hypothetical protein [Gemmatimonadaceae bacterium]
MTRVHVTLGATLMMVMAACGAEPPNAQDSAAAVPAVVVDTPRAESQPYVYVTEYGIGDLRAGMTLAQAARAAAGIRLIPGTDSTECSYLEWTNAPAGVLVMFDEGTVARIDIDSVGVRTQAGAQVGDSEARIDSLYAGRVTTTPHKYEDGHYLTVTSLRAADSLFRTVFETVGGKVTRFRVGRTPQVEYVEGCS